MEHVVIIGNGIAGVTTARFIRKHSDKKITIISSETEHFFSRTALMYIYMGHMKFENTKPYEDWFWSKNRIDLIYSHVDQINFEEKSLSLRNNSQIKYDKLVLALGSKPNKFGWPGQDLKGVQGLYSYQDLESMEYYSKGLNKAVIVGGGLIGIEMAEMFKTRNIDVCFLVREESFWNNVLPAAESAMINRHIIHHGIDLRLNTNLTKIIPDEKGKCKAVKTDKGEIIECGFVGLTAGVSPNIDFLKNTDLSTDKGILVDNYFQTNIEEVYAVGDCAQFIEPPKGRRPIEQVWYTGRMHGETLAMNICNIKKPYQPGPWFNSAKFFDVEYQTYGMVLPDYDENEKGIYWEHEDGTKCMHLVFDKNSLVVKGFNIFGIRHRHEVWDKWLREHKTVRYVLENIQSANFDPEFFNAYETELVDVFNKTYSKHRVEIKRKKRFLEKIGF
ncbi:NAD(P)/FAD-dependent oxidoreductase [Hyphobacterium sp. CCMP332]|nr:NAD(P)/FAD-dependent oxidoreductase [Hyphobacterium sp. CCMP332]